MNDSPDTTRSLPDPFRRNIVWSICQIVLRWFFGLLLGFRTRGLENLPSDSGALLLVNHQSNFDPLLVGVPLSRPVSFVAPSTLFVIPIVGWILRRTYAVPSDREAARSGVIREMVGRLDHGFLVGMFPEGTRTSDGKMKSAQAGIGLTIIKSRAPVVPVRLWTYNTYGRHRRMPRLAPIAVKFGHPIHFHSLREKAATCPRPELRNLYQQATNETMTAIAAMRPVMDRA